MQVVVLKVHPELQEFLVQVDLLVKHQRKMMQQLQQQKQQ